MTTSAISKKTNGKPKPDNRKVEHDFLAVGIGASAGGIRAGDLLRGTERHFRTLFELGPVAIFSCDLAGVIQDYNQRAAEMWGREPKRGDPSEKYCGSFKLFRPDGRLLPHDESPIVEVLRAGVAVGGVEVFIERPDGTRVPVIVNFSPLIDELGAVSGAITSFLDITERKHAEETLRASEELNVAVISSLSAQIAVLDSDGIITDVNQAWQDFARENNGKSDRNGIGINYLQICRNSAGKFAENASEAMIGIKAVLKGKLPFFSLEYPCHSPNERRWFLLNVTPLRTESGGGVVSHQNITERKKAEEELRKTEEFTRSIIDSSPDCIKVLDLEGNLLSMQAGQELLCIDDITPFLNKPWTELWEGIDRQSAQSAVEAAAAGGNGNFVGFFRNMRGEPKWWNVAISPILGADGNPSRLLAVSRDVTEQKEADEALRKHEWRLRYATESARLTFVEIDLIGGGALTPDNFAAVMGYPPPAGQEEDASVGSRVLLEHVVPDDRPRVEAALREFFDGKSVGQIDYRVLGDDRIERWIETRWSMELSPDGKPLKSFATNLDITERKQAEEALRNSEERYRNLFTSMDEGYCIIEMIFDGHGKPVDWRFLEVNPSFEKQTGMHDTVGKLVRDMVPDHEQHWFDIYGKVALTGEPIRFVNEAKGLDRWFDLYAFRIGGPDSRKVAVIFSNITERKQEEQRIEMRSALSRELAGATEEAEIVRIAVEAVGHHLNGHRCYFVECLADENRLIVSHNWVRDKAPSIAGELSLFDFGGPDWWRQFASGDFFIEDVATNPLTQANSASYHAVGVPSYAVQPFRREGPWTVCLVVTEASPRKWTAYDLRVMDDVVARVWPLVESARSVRELRKSEFQLRLTLDSTELGAWNIDPVTNAISTDERFRAIFGVTAKDLSYEQMFDIVHPDDRGGVSDAVAEAIRPDDPVPFEAEYRVVRTDGSLHWVFSKGRANFGNGPAGRTLLSFDGTVADITERKQHEANLAFLADIGQDLAQITTVEETMQTIGAKIGKHFGATLCTFADIDMAADRASFEHEWCSDGADSHIGEYKMSEFVTEEFSRDSMAGIPIVVQDAFSSPYAVGENVAASNVRSFVTIPLIRNGAWRFQLGIHDSAIHAWREDEVELLRELATRIFTRLERARAEEALAESEERTRAIVENVSEYAIITMNAAGIITGWNTGAEKIFGYAREEVIGSDAEVIFTPEDREAGIPEREMRTALAEGSSLDERYHIRKDGVRIFVSGTLSRLPLGPAAGFVKIVRDMTEQIAAEKVRQSAETLRTLVRGQEHERKRLARDLHDELGQQLTALRMKLDLLHKSGGASNPLLDEIIGMAEDVDEGVDRLAWDLRPAALDDLGLHSALDRFVREWSRHTKIRAELINSNLHGVRLTSEVETNLYRIAQEALNNVHKHSRAANVAVMLRKRDDSIMMMIEDDGKGFDPRGKNIGAGGLGLTGMRERAALINGDFEIDSAPGKGATIYLRVPLNAIRSEDEE